MFQSRADSAVTYHTESEPCVPRVMHTCQSSRGGARQLSARRRAGGTRRAGKRANTRMQMCACVHVGRGARGAGPGQRCAPGCTSCGPRRRSRSWSRTWLRACAVSHNGSLSVTAGSGAAAWTEQAPRPLPSLDALPRAHIRRRRFQSRTRPRTASSRWSPERPRGGPARSNRNASGPAEHTSSCSSRRGVKRSE